MSYTLTHFSIHLGEKEKGTDKECLLGWEEALMFSCFDLVLREKKNPCLRKNPSKSLLKSFCGKPMFMAIFAKSNLRFPTISLK